MRNASTKFPVGTSKVLMTESCDDVMIHLESGENAFVMRCRGGSRVGSRRSPRGKKRGGKWWAYEIADLTLGAGQFTHHPLRLDIDDAHGEIVADDGEERIVALKDDRRD